MGFKKQAGLLGLGSVLLFSAAVPAMAETNAAVNMPLEAKTVMVQGAGTGAGTASTGDQTVAGAKISRDEAVVKARELAGVPDDYSLESIFFNSVNGGQYSGKGPSWSMYFTKKTDERMTASINVTIQADSGQLLSFYKYANNGSSQTYPPKTDYSEAKQIAQKFLQERVPAEWKETRYNDWNERNFKTPLGGEIRYNIRYDRLVNGIPFPANGLNVEVNGSGEIVSFSMEWDRSFVFEKSSPILSASEAFEAMKRESGLTLSYLFPYQAKKFTDPAIGYTLSIPVLRAVDGQPFYPGSIQTDNNQPLTEAPMGNAPKQGPTLTKDRAVQAVTKVFQLPDGATLEDASYSESSEYPTSELVSRWNLRWSIPEQKETGTTAAKDAPQIMPPVPNRMIYATVNAKTGEMTQYSMYNNIIYGGQPGSQEQTYPVSYEQARRKAIDFVKKMVPYLTHQLVLADEDSLRLTEDQLKNMPTLGFSFNRVIDGVKANYEGVRVTVDRKTGEITEYSNMVTAIPYPVKKPNVMDESTARDKWLAQYSIELQYMIDYTAANPGIPVEKYNLMLAAGEIPPAPPASNGEQPEVKLVYTAVPKYSTGLDIYLDAVKGEWMDRSTGEPAVMEKPEAVDIKGHWAEKELRLMVEYGALDVQDGKVNPNQTATRGEMIKMLIMAVNGGNFSYASYDSSRKASFNDVAAGSKYFAYIENAVDRNLIDPKDKTFNPDAPMSREELADLIVRALGYSNLAKKTGLFQLNAQDAQTIKTPGDVALVVGLGIMTTEHGRFRPEEKVTRAQAATAFYRYLRARAELTYRPVF